MEMDGIAVGNAPIEVRSAKAIELKYLSPVR